MTKAFVGSPGGLVDSRGAPLRARTELHLVHYRPRKSGRNRIIEDFGLVHRGELGLVALNRIVTTAGVNYLASTFTGTGAPANFNFHAFGTTGTAEVIANTALAVEVESRATGTQSNPSANIYRTVGTVTFTTGRSIVEWGLFSASSVGTMLDRVTFTAIAVVNLDSIAATFNLTLTAGS